MRATLVTLSAMSAVLGGCSLVFSSDLNAARTPNDDVTPVDGGDAGSNPLPDGSSEATTGDVVVQPNTRGCGAYQPQPKFCKDFDDSAVPVADGWDQVLTQAGQIVRDDAIGYSPPGSLRINQTTSSGCLYTRLNKDFPNIGSKRAAFHMRMRPSSPWQNDTVIPVAFQLEPGPGDYCAALIYLHRAAGDAQAIGSASLLLQYDGTPTMKQDARPLNGFPPVDEWTEVGIVATPSLTGGLILTFSFLRENAERTETVHEFSQCKLAGGRLSIHPGFHCEAGGAAEVRYDDIRVDWE